MAKEMPEFSRGQILYTPTPDNTLLGMGGVYNGGGRPSQIPAAGASKCTPQPPSLENALWPESEVSKRGWRTEGVGARKPFKGQRLRPLCCNLLTFFLCPLRQKDKRVLFGGLFVANPFSKPLTEIGGEAGGGGLMTLPWTKIPC